MTKHLLSLAAAAALFAFAVPAQACDMHASHDPVTNAEAAPAPVPEAKPVTVIRTEIEQPAEEAAMSKVYSSESGYMGCNRRAKEQTVYLTQ
jgi:hypothetical protein